MKNQPKISVQKTRKIGLFHTATGKVTSLYTYEEAFREGFLEEELRRCEEYLDRNFERLCKNPDGTVNSEFEISLPGKEFAKWLKKEGKNG